MRTVRWYEKKLAIGLIGLICFAGSRKTPADDLDNIIFTGVVRDTTGAVVVAARVMARHTTTATERAIETDEQGRYTLLVTAPGLYEVRVHAEGFQAAKENLTIATVGRKIILNFILSPAQITDHLTVSPATASRLDTTRTVVGDTIERREIDDLPIADRDPLRLIFLLAGVMEAPLSTGDLAEEGRGVFVRNAPEEAGIFSLTGAPATSNNLTIDGLDNNDDRAARERIRLAPESIAEVQVITNQYAAEYGRASGGRINLRTRGGANEYRGEAYIYFGDESINANTFFRNARGLPRIPQSEFREGVIFNGPLVKEQSFFLAQYERLDVSDFAEINTLVPVQTNPRFPLPKPNQLVAAGSLVGLLFEEIATPETSHTMNAKFDIRFTQQHNAILRTDLARGKNRRGFTGGSRLADTILIGGRNSVSISYIDNYVFSKSLLNQTRFQFSRLLPRNRVLGDGIGVIIEEPQRVIAGTFTGSDAAPAFARQEDRTQIQENLTLVRGAHIVKVGLDLQLVHSTFTDLFATGGQYEFAHVEDFLANRPNRFLQRFDTESRAANTVVGLFVQDEWKALPNVTISLGLRWDQESILKDQDNFSPRLAVAWDPWGTVESKAGKTVLRAGFGLFFNRALLRTLDDFSLGKSTLTVDSELTPEILGLVRFPFSLSDRHLVERFGVSEVDFLRRLSENLEIPYTVQSGFGIERQVSKHLVVSADYIFTRGAHLWREANINAPRLPAGFANFTEYLLSRDFDNRPVQGARPIASTNADIIRFDLGANLSTSSGAIQTEHGLRVVTLGLNAPRSGNLTAVLRAVRLLRPDPSLTQVERLESTGNSFYHGGMIALRYQLGSNSYFRASYTFAKLIDEGTTNTASPQDLNDRRAERAISLQDQRHRLAFNGVFLLPRCRIQFAPVLALGSSKPFNIGAGFDRNLNDIANDRPQVISAIDRPIWRRPGVATAALDADTEALKRALQLAPIGSNGTLPRNYGRGPGTFVFNLRAARVFSLTEHMRIRPAIDVFNVFNHTTFSFGAEFIDRDDRDFLIPRRTQRPRVVQVNVKLDF